MFDRKYPLDLKKNHHYVMAGTVALWIFLFLFFAEPFKIDRFSFVKKLWALPIYGLIQAAAYLAALPYQNAIVFTQKKKWTLGNEIVYFALVTLVAWLSNYGFYIFFVTSHENTYSFLDHARFHFLPGLAFVLPIFSMARYALGFLYERNLLSKKDYITLGEGKTDVLKLLRSELVCIKSEDNYLAVYFFRDGNLERKMVRGNLNTVIKKYPELKRVHRSYIINPLKYSDAKSNSGKLSLLLQGNLEVPVSRNIRNEVKSFFGIS